MNMFAIAPGMADILYPKTSPMGLPSKWAADVTLPRAASGTPLAYPLDSVLAGARTFLANASPLRWQHPLE